MKVMIPSEEWKQQVEDMKSLKEGYSSNVASTKKIYCHPITITSSNTNYKFRFSCMILNNDSTAFTLTTFKKFIDDLYTSIGTTIRINCSGGAVVISGGKQLILSWLSKYADDGYSLAGFSLDTNDQEAGIVGTWDGIFGSSVTFNDGVNAIN